MYVCMYVFPCVAHSLFSLATAEIAQMHVLPQLHACSPRLLYRDRLIDSLMHPGNPVPSQDQLRRHVVVVAKRTVVQQ